jgi:hypothetical protein
MQLAEPRFRPGVACCPGEQFLGLGQLALAAPQIGQPHDRL